MIDDPIWLAKAREYIGTREIPGPKSNSTILRWWRAIRSAISSDAEPWCAGFVGGVLEEVGIKSTRAANARSYLKHGRELDGPAVGAVVVFWRGKPDGWSGHVGFVVGRDERGNLMVLGGNQGDAVNIKPFGRGRVLGYRWPTGGYPRKDRYHLPILASDGELSENEA
jgi:uncharacterized protein (TIGR02594 family)